MEAEFVIEALEAANDLKVWVSSYREHREAMAECLRLEKNIPYILTDMLFHLEKGAPIRKLTHLLIRATDTDCKVAGWSALIARSREAVDSLCSTFEKYPPQETDGLDIDAVDLLRTVQGLEKRKATISRKSTTTSQSTHFNSPQSKDDLTTIFQRLKEGCYFDDSADLNTWLYICGGDLNGDFRPLNWISEVQLLGWLVYDMFPNDKSNLWEIAKRCFTVKGRSPNINSMKNMISVVENGYKDKSKKIVDFEKLLK